MRKNLIISMLSLVFLLTSYCTNSKQNIDSNKIILKDFTYIATLKDRDCNGSMDALKIEVNPKTYYGSGPPVIKYFITFFPGIPQPKSQEEVYIVTPKFFDQFKGYNKIDHNKIFTPDLEEVISIYPY